MICYERRLSASTATGSENQCCKPIKFRGTDMSDKHPSNSSEESNDNRDDKESYLDRAERLQAERVEFGKELDQRIADLAAADERRAAEFDRQQAENRQARLRTCLQRAGSTTMRSKRCRQKSPSSRPRMTSRSRAWWMKRKNAISRSGV